jgi:hypothetical protein
MYHLEMRQLPHNACRFNLSEAELTAVVVPWARKEWVELGERKWNPNEARLTIFEGPELALDQLKMGRGWGAAQRTGVDVTERVLDAARAQIEQEARVSAPAAGQDADALGIGVRLASLLGPDAERLLDSWRAAAIGSPGLKPSESLALAESTLGAREPAAG